GQSKNSCPERRYSDSQFRKEEEYEIELQHERSAAQKFHVSAQGKPEPARAIEPADGNEDSNGDGDGERQYAQNDRHTSGFEKNTAIVPHNCPTAFANAGCDDFCRASIYSLPCFGSFRIAIKFCAVSNRTKTLLLVVPDAVFTVNPLQLSIADHGNERCIDGLDERGFSLARIDDVISFAHWFADEDQGRKAGRVKGGDGSVFERTV